jgi:tetratricopeptide (TPR) repeat protein
MQSPLVKVSMISCVILPLLAVLAFQHAWGQTAGQRIVTLEGFGDYFVSAADGQPQLVRPDGLGVNIVAVVQRIDGDRIWLQANGAGDQAVGWVNRTNAIPLDDAIAWFTTRIEHNPKDWDAYLRRAESEHALNQRDAAIADYTRAIALHPGEAFLFLRRGREFRILKACPQAAADFEQTVKLRPGWAEAWGQAAGVYSDCPDPLFRNQAKAIALIEKAISLDKNPTRLTVLAMAYFRSGRLEDAVATQKQAVESPAFPPGYRDEAMRQLQEFEDAVAAQKH